MDFHYCDWAGSSKGMKYVVLLPLYFLSSVSSNAATSCSGFIKSVLPRFAAAHPQIEFQVSPRPSKHPVIVGHYINGKTKTICVRNLEPLQVLKKAELLREASGEKLKRTTKPVTSSNPSVRGIWSPFHGEGMKV